MAIGNGDTEHAELKDLVYDEDNPIYVNKCSRQMNDKNHMDTCDGTCERVVLSEIEIALINEQRAWQRAGMNPGMAAFSIHDVLFELSALRKYVDTHMGIDQDEYALYVNQACLEFYKKVRTDNEERIKQEQMMQRFAIPGRAPLLGPDGSPISR